MEKKSKLYESGSLFKNKENKEDTIRVCFYTGDMQNLKVGINSLDDQVNENVRFIPLEELTNKYEYTNIVLVGNQKYFDNGISLVEYEPSEKKDKQL